MENSIGASAWPEWEIVRKIGSGAYGVVYEAVRKDTPLKSRAAIKVITIPQNESEIESLRAEGFSEDKTRAYLKGVVDDFIGEIGLMESFKGVQNIVSVEDYKVVERTDSIGWDVYIRMELLTPFNVYIQDRTLSEDEVIKLGIDICKALELCKQKNVIHRDIKPENIFVNQFGDFKLGDFGIARTLENRTIGLSQKGTYSYMAPEVEKGLHYDASVDLYSLGLVLYRLMNKNRLPFIYSDAQMLSPRERMVAIRRRMDGEPLAAPCMASQAFASVILCACSYKSEKRFRNPLAMKNALIHAGEVLETVNGDMEQSEDTNVWADPDETVSVHRPAEEYRGYGSEETVSVPRPAERQKRSDSSAIPSWDTTDQSYGKKPPKRKSAVLYGFLVLIILLLAGVCVMLGLKILGADSEKEDSTADSASSVQAEVAESSAQSEVTESSSAEEEEGFTDWKDAYVDYLENCDQNTGIEGFMLFDANKDEVPELLLWYEEHDSVGLISWYDNKITENGLGEYCSTIDGVSGITFYPKSQVIYSQSIAPSNTGKPVLSVLKDGKLSRKDSVKDKDGVNNYTLSDAYQMTDKDYKDKVYSWTPKNAFKGSKPVTTKTSGTEKTSTKTENGSSDKAGGSVSQGPAAGTIMTILKPDEGLNLRDASDINSNVLIEIHGTIPLIYQGAVEQGYGSDGAIHDWYQVTTDDIYGWVRGDLVRDTGMGYLIHTPEGNMNMRSDPDFNSQLVAAITPGTRLVFMGQTGTGKGSDGVNHQWLYVRIMNPITGWMRSDLLSY